MNKQDQKVVDLLKNKFTLDLLELYQKRIGFSKIQYEIIKHYYILKDKDYQELADDYGYDKRTIERAIKSIKEKFKVAIDSRKYVNNDAIRYLCELCGIEEHE